MTNVTNTTSPSGFFPNSKKGVTNTKANQKLQQAVLNRNDPERKEQLDTLAKADSKVTIPDAIRDFSRIKKAVDAAPEISKEDRIAELKSQINNGTYKVDYDALADKMLSQEY